MLDLYAQSEPEAPLCWSRGSLESGCLPGEVRTWDQSSMLTGQCFSPGILNILACVGAAVSTTSHESLLNQTLINGLSLVPHEEKAFCDFGQF